MRLDDTKATKKLIDRLSSELAEVKAQRDGLLEAAKDALSAFCIFTNRNGKQSTLAVRESDKLIAAIARCERGKG